MRSADHEADCARNTGEADRGVGADYAETPLSKFAAVSALGSLAAATLASAFQTLIAGFEIMLFLRRQRHAVAAAPIGRILYINANLWFGVKAGGSVGHISGVINALLQKGMAVDFASCGTRLMVHDGAKYVPLEAPKAFGVPFEINYYRFSRYVARLLGHDRLRAKKMAATVAKILVGSPVVSESSNQFLKSDKSTFLSFSRH